MSLFENSQRRAVLETPKFQSYVAMDFVCYLEVAWVKGLRTEGEDIQNLITQDTGGNTLLEGSKTYPCNFGHCGAGGVGSSVHTTDMVIGELPLPFHGIIHYVLPKPVR